MKIGRKYYEIRALFLGANPSWPVFNVVTLFLLLSFIGALTRIVVTLHLISAHIELWSSVYTMDIRGTELEIWPFLKMSRCSSRIIFCLVKIEVVKAGKVMMIIHITNELKLETSHGCSILTQGKHTLEIWIMIRFSNHSNSIILNFLLSTCTIIDFRH